MNGEILKYMATQVAILLVALLSFIGIARADTVTANPKATATLSAVCSISIPTGANFGALNVTSLNSTTTQLNITCTKGTQFKIAMLYPHNGQGNYNGTYFSGMMLPSKTGNTNWVNYNIFLPNGNYWGNQVGTVGAGGSAVGVLTEIGTGQLQNYPILITCGTALSTTQIYAYITPDTYSDTVTASVSF